MKKHYRIGLLGLTLLLFSYILAIFSDPSTSLTGRAIKFALEYLGITTGFGFLFNSIEYKLHQRSLLGAIREKPLLFWRILLIGVLIGIFSEYFGGIVSRIWWEPLYSQTFASWPFWFAALIWLIGGIGIGYGSLGFAIFSIYRALNLLLLHFDSSRHLRLHIDSLFYWLAWIGGIAVILPLLIIYFFPDLGLTLRGALFALPLLGLWFIFEYVEHHQHRRSLLFDIFKFKTGKVIAIIITSILIGFAIEGLNAITPVWKYDNLPFINFQIVSIPLVGLLGWIPFIILYLSLYRIFVKYDRSTF